MMIQDYSLLPAGQIKARVMQQLGMVKTCLVLHRAEMMVSFRSITHLETYLMPKVKQNRTTMLKLPRKRTQSQRVESC